MTNSGAPPDPGRETGGFKRRWEGWLFALVVVGLISAYLVYLLAKWLAA